VIAPIGLPSRFVLLNKFILLIIIPLSACFMVACLLLVIPPFPFNPVIIITHLSSQVLRIPSP
jgi:hypothetical protein